MDVQQIKTQAVRFNRARNNLMLVVVLTMVNLILIILDINVAFLFSAIIPQYVLLYMGVSVPSAVVAMALLSLYLMFFFLSKQWRVFILIAFIVFAIDTIFLLWFVTSYMVDTREFIFDFLFHAWIHFYLIGGTIAWIKLMGVSQEDFRAVIAMAAYEAEKEEVDSALNDIAPKDDPNKSDSEIK